MQASTTFVGSAIPAEPVAWQYRWKLDGEWVDWRVADHSQKSQHLRDLEERPLYAAPRSDGLRDARNAALEEAAKLVDVVMCGGCKATGIKMVWNDQGELEPTEPKEPCPTCNGSGWAPAKPKPPAFVRRMFSGKHGS